ncbi:MAG TPA: hypothetical protein VLI40_02175, partial [Gemmatimonadaceae bacterium]|nr:hypothetical protein [Gemmatimonadaceae bacterium]
LRELEIIARKSNLAAQIFGESATANVATRSPERASIQRGEHVRATIEKWRCTSADVIDPANGSYVAAFARAARSAALGVWIVDGNATLLSWNEAFEVSNDPGVIEAVTDLADRAEDATCDEMVTRLSSILRSADSWYQQRCAWHALGAPAGNVTVPGVHDARRSLARVADAASANAHFARRSHSAALAARLRSAATTPLPLAVEWSLESLTGSPDEATVDTILELVDKARHTASHVQVKGLRPVALIVMSPAGISK